MCPFGHENLDKNMKPNYFATSYVCIIFHPSLISKEQFYRKAPRSAKKRYMQHRLSLMQYAKYKG